MSVNLIPPMKAALCCVSFPVRIQGILGISVIITSEMELSVLGIYLIFNASTANSVNFIGNNFRKFPKNI